MIITCYQTGLDPQHKRVVDNVPRFLDTLTAHEEELRGQLVAGAPSHVITLNSVALYDYCEIDGTFYFLVPKRITPTAVVYDASIDWWALYGSGGIELRGTLVQGHTLTEAVSFGLPVDPVVGDVKDAITMAEQIGYPDRVTLVVSYTTGNDPARAWLITSPVFRLSDTAVIEATIANMSAATKIDNEEIKSTNGMWLLPSFEFSFPSSPNVTLSTNVGNGTTYGAYHFVRTYYNQADVAVPRTIYPTMVGNFGSGLKVPFNGRKKVEYSVQVAINGSSGMPAVLLRVGDTSIDITESLSVSYATNTKSQLDSQRNVENAIGVVGSLLALGGGIFTGNPLAIAGGIAGVAGTAARIATTPTAYNTAHAGNGMLNTTAGVGVASKTVGCWGVMRYNMLNEDAVLGALRRYGYIGALEGYFNPPIEVSDGQRAATWYKFVNPEFLTNMPDDCRRDLTAMFTRGFTIYYWEAFGGDYTLPQIDFGNGV